MRRDDGRSAEQLKQALYYQKRKRSALEEEIAQSSGKKEAGMIASLWYVRVGLADPSLPAQTLSSFCKDFPLQETKTISASYVSTVRDAMAEVVKGHSYDQIETLVAHAEASGMADADILETRPFVIPHAHDEVSDILKGLGKRFYLHQSLLGTCGLFLPCSSIIN